MKKLFRIVFVFVLVLGVSACSSSSSKGDKTEEKGEDVKVSALEKVEKVFTLSVEEDSQSGTMFVRAQVGGEEDPRFTYYAMISEKDELLAAAYGIEEGDLVYENYSYSYVVGTYSKIYSHVEATKDDVKKEVETTLSQAGITLDELKEAMQEKYESK